MNQLAILRSVVLCGVTLHAQTPVRVLDEQAGRIFPWDAAVLEHREARTSLPCTVRPEPPELGFDFHLHAGYEVRLRLRDLAGEDNVLTAIFRVTPDNTSEKPVHFEQKWRVPPLRENAKGSVSLNGQFDVGEGKYRVDWLIRDRNERICSAHWTVNARLPKKTIRAAPNLSPGSAVATYLNRYGRQESLRGDSERPFAIAVLLSVGPTTGTAAMSSADSKVLRSILRGITSDPRIARLSFTAYSLDLRQVIYKQEDTPEINFAELKTAMDESNVGTIHIAHLAQRNAEAQFLNQLVAGQVRQGSFDALIFVGPSAVDQPVKRGALSFGDISFPVFSLNYETVSGLNPWHNLIGLAVRQLRGHEFMISTPLDLVSAWSKIMSQLEKGNSLRRDGEN